MTKYTVYKEDGETVVEAEVTMDVVDHLLNGDLDTNEIEWALDEHGRCDCPNGYVIVDSAAPVPGPYEDNVSQG